LHPRPQRRDALQRLRTYVFGGLGTDCAAALIDGARLLAAAADGILPWRGRPEPLKRGLIARIPPFDFEEDRV
jgi:predicted metal-binding protein